MKVFYKMYKIRSNSFKNHMNTFHEENIHFTERRIILLDRCNVINFFHVCHNKFHIILNIN